MSAESFICASYKLVVPPTVTGTPGESTYPAGCWPNVVSLMTGPVEPINQFCEVGCGSNGRGLCGERCKCGVRVDDRRAARSNDVEQPVGLVRGIGRGRAGHHGGPGRFVGGVICRVTHHIEPTELEGCQQEQEEHRRR